MDQLMPHLSADGTRWLPHFSDLMTSPALKVDSANGANAQVTATLAAAAAQMTYITGFQIRAKGATAGSTKTVAISGLLGGTQNFSLTVVAGATLDNNLDYNFPDPVPASAVNTAIVGTLPALGAGNTNAIITVLGFRGNSNLS